MKLMAAITSTRTAHAPNVTIRFLMRDWRTRRGTGGSDSLMGAPLPVIALYLKAEPEPHFARLHLLK
jgi:hypothetical protein